MSAISVLLDQVIRQGLLKTNSASCEFKFKTNMKDIIILITQITSNLITALNYYWVLTFECIIIMCISLPLNVNVNILSTKQILKDIVKYESISQLCIETLHEWRKRN